MRKTYLNRHGAEYHLPDFGSPVRWVSCVMLAERVADLPSSYYFECDAENWACRAIHIYEGGRVLLAYPGGLDGDHLPDAALPPVGETAQAGVETREIIQAEFDLLWLALLRQFHPRSGE